MLSFRQKNPISSYTKFQITLSPTLSLSEILERIEERVEKLLGEDSLLNIGERFWDVGFNQTNAQQVATSWEYDSATSLKTTRIIFHEQRGSPLNVNSSLTRRSSLFFSLSLDSLLIFASPRKTVSLPRNPPPSDSNTKKYTRRNLKDIIHTYKSSTEPPIFSTVSFSSINTNVPVHVFLSEKSHSIFFFIDHCIADGLTMYNEVVGPVLGNPRYVLLN